jgi:AsmA protein
MNKGEWGAIMRKFLIGLAVVVVLLIGAVVALPFFIPVDWVKEQAQTQASQATGRQLTIAGDVSLSVFPNVRIEANDVHFANEPGSPVTDMVSLSKLALDVQLMPLLSGDLVVDEFVLIDPVIYLEGKSDGGNNWQFTPQQDAEGTASDSSGTESTGDSDGSGLANLTLGDVRIENGQVTYLDGKSGETTVVSGINMVLSLPDLASPFNGEGSFTFKDKTLKLATSLASPKALMDGGSSDATVIIESEPLNVSFNGSVAQAGAVTGKVDLSIPSLSGLALWMEQPLDPSSPAPETIQVSGTLDMNGDNIAFNGAEVTIDDLKARGDIAVNMGGDRPSITANLQSDMLDLNPYLPQPEEGAGDAGASSDDGASSDSGDSLAQGWSDEEIDFSGLDAANADLAGLKVQAIEIGRSRLHIVVNNGSATIDLLEAALYGGNGTAHVEIDRSGSRPAIAKTFSATGIQAEPLLAAAAGFDKLSGTADLKIDVTTTGASQKQFVENLFGNGDFIFRDGAFKGINIAAVVRDLSIESIGEAVSPSEATDFAELSGTYNIENGMLANNDLFMSAPLFRMDGEGNVNMPDKTLDYTITPKATSSLEGQGADDTSGLGIPINVRGPWAGPAITPDLEAIAKNALTNPEAIGETLEMLGGDDAGGLLDGLTGGGDGEGEGGGLLDGLTGDSDSGGLGDLF